MDGMRFKKYLVWFSRCFALGSLGIVAVNWIADPLQFYRKAAYPPLLIEQKRFQAPGLARNYDYDTVVVGTSMSIIITAKQIKEKLGFSALNLSMQGASVAEQHMMLDVALRTGKVKRVIWEVNYEYLRGTPEWVANYDGTFPYYFYDENPFNEINNYLLNIDTTKNTLKVFLARCGLRTYRSRDLEDLLGRDGLRQFGRSSLQQSWHSAMNGLQGLRKQAPDFAVTHLNRNFDVNIMRLIRENPDVQFYLYFPPFSAAYYAYVTAAAPEVFAHLLENRKHIFLLIAGVGNVELYDFQSVDSLIFNMDNYCDLVHSNSSVDDYILESIRDRRHVLTMPGLSQFEALVNSQRFSSWVEQNFK